MGLSNRFSCEAGSSSLHLNPHRFLHSEVLRLYFPVLESWVAWPISLPTCSSQFICTQMWDCPVSQLLPCLPWSPSCCLAASPLPSSCPSLPLLQVWMNVSSLTPWLSDFHTVRFSGSSGYFLFLNLLCFFWLCEEAKCIYLYLHLGQKSLTFNFQVHVFLVSCVIHRKDT